MAVATAVSEPDALLAVGSLHRHFAGLQALDGVDLSVRPGELLAIIGPNGAGKSTLFNVVTGLLAPSSGEVKFDGSPISGLPPHRIARLGIGRKFQVPNVFDGLSVRQNLVVASRGKEGLRGLLGHDRVDPERIREILDRLGLEPKAELQAVELSHGERQWLEIGAVLVSDPKLLLLDEPTAGMTMRETRSTEDLLHGLAEGHTVVVIEHNIRFVREVAQRVVVMHRGRILADGTIAQIERDERVRDVYLGRTA